MQKYQYANTIEHLYEDIALWEKEEGVQLFQEMPLNGNQIPRVLDFGYGFGEYLFAAANAFPNGMIYGVDGYPVSQKEVSQKVENDSVKNVKLINKVMYDLKEFEDDSFDLMLLYDMLHGGDGKLKYMLFEEAKRVIKPGGCLSILPVHLGNWRDRQGKKKAYTIEKIVDEISGYGFKYSGTCNIKGIHWEKCHTLYYIQKKSISFDILERADIMNFIKK
ncbi:MAG TPA: class I SAM-dependent methyltransferase [Lachnospiraceae bacterium]|nr:class I SAM-dependent methyltransferase [Lachnospiraceae bacterium]